MSSLLKKNGFKGFGASIFPRVARRKTEAHEFPRERLESRKMLRDLCPRTPGIYGWLDENRRLIYVGKAKSLRNRLLSYFCKTPPDDKMLRIVQHAKTLAWEPVGHELLALMREQELISRWRPSFNVQGQPERKQPAFLCISKGAAPNAFFAHQLSSKSHLTYGPIAGSKQMRQSVVSVNYAFQLRDCPDKTSMHFNNQRELFTQLYSAGCIRFELDSCPGPCAGLCSHENYNSVVQSTINFLEGRDRSILETLKQKMDRASRKRAFEKAAVLRDQYKDLTWLDRRLEGLRKARYELNAIYPVGTFDKHSLWLILRAGRVQAACRTPHHVKSAEWAKLQIEQVQGATGFDIPTKTHDINMMMILVSWFRKHPAELEKLIPYQTGRRISDQVLDG